jgi:DNA mismatch endonuclease (patch repair protein)
MPDVFTRAKRSEVMSRIRSHGNKKTELALIGLLKKNKIKGWRRQVTLGMRSLTGSHQRQHVKVDFVFRSARLALFVDGCFWHACPKHSSCPSNNREFWQRKLIANRERDRKVNRALRTLGWSVVRIWEHELTRKSEARTVAKLGRALGSSLKMQVERLAIS